MRRRINKNAIDFILALLLCIIIACLHGCRKPVLDTQSPLGEDGNPSTMTNDTKKLKEVEQIIIEMAEIINAPKKYFPRFDLIIGDATPCISVDDKGYHYIISERGTEYEHDIYPLLDDLLYEVFRDITFSIACDYGVQNRVEKQDFRRILFEHQLELLNKINPIFEQKRKIEIEDILEKHPFQDELF